MRVVTYTSAGVLVRSWWVPGSIPMVATMTDYGDVLVGSHSLGGGPRSVTRFATGGAVEELELEVEIDLGYIAELSTGELLISAWAAEPTPWGDFVFENGFVTVLDIDSHDPLVSFPDAWIVRDDDGAHWLDKRRLDDATLTLGESHASYPYDLIGWPGGGVGFLTDATPAQVPDVPAADVSNYRALWRDVGAGLDPVLVAVVRRHHMIVGTGDGGYWGIQWNIQLWRTTFTRYFANSPLTTSYEISVAGYLEGTPTLVPSTNELLVGLTRAGAQELGSPELQPNSRIIPTILRPL
jgi:hypothetical protein